MTPLAAARSTDLTIQSIATRAVRVPLRFTLGTSAAIVTAVPLLLIDVLMDVGVTGRSYLFCYSTSGARAIAGHITEAASLIEGKAAAPFDLAQFLSRRFALLGVTGPVRMALAAIDIAVWDALAVSFGQPLAVMLGGAPRPIRAYDSRGLGLMNREKLPDEAEALLAKGLRAVKLRLGYPSLADDLAAVRSVRGRIPDDVPLMVDYNQALTQTEAILRGRALQGEGIAWLEEPIRHDDYLGNAAIARATEIPLQIGENFNGPEAMATALAEGACDYVMPDGARIGGVTGWMQAAGIAAARGVEMSSHLIPEISAHLLCATPTAHWLEYVDWADAILEQPLEIAEGSVICSKRPGLGMTWDEDKIRRLQAI